MDSTTSSIEEDNDKMTTILGKNLKQINFQYNSNLQIAKFTDLQKYEKQNILIEVGLDKDSSDNQSLVFFIDGSQQPIHHEFVKFTYLFIKTLDNKIDSKMYTIVYFVGNELLGSNFQRFREYLKILPPKYYAKLKSLYVFHANLFLRSYLWFEGSKRGKLWKKKTQYIGELTQIFQIPNFHKRWLDLVPLHYQYGSHLEELRQERENSINLNPQSNQIVQVIFGQNIEQYKQNQLGIPELLDKLICYFYRNLDKLKEQGIFRKAGSVSEEAQLTDLLSKGHYEALYVVNDSNLVASMLKKYFSQMPIPLINFDLYKIIVKELRYTAPNNEVAFIMHILDKLPQLNRKVLQMMLSFLLQISQYQDSNKMTVSNLAVVFAPCFLRPVELTIEEITNTGITIKFINMLLAHYDEIFPNISYKLFLTEQDQSQSTSTNSSTGVGEQLKQIEEEKIQQPQQQIEQFDDHSNLRDIINPYKRTQTEIQFESQIKKQFIQKNQFSDDEEIEYSIDDILGHVKENKPINPKKGQKDGE